jgi:choline kinase
MSMTTTVAVILVAGVGSRLRPLTDDRPKALVDIGGETILGRAVRLLSDYGVERIVLATGYREDAVRGAMRGVAPRVEYYPNQRYDSTQNSVSLALCRAGVRGEAFFKLDGDVVFQPEVLERLDASTAPLAAALDSGRHLDEEAMKARVGEDRRILAFGKQIAVAGSAGESIGIERISAGMADGVFDALEAAIADGDEQLYYEDVYSRLIASGALQAEAVDVSDLPWTEVDDSADLERARALIQAGMR